MGKCFKILFSVMFVFFVMVDILIASKVSDKTLAVVNGTPIFTSEFNNIFFPILEQYKQNVPISEQTKIEINKLKDAVLNKKIESILLKQEVQKQRIKVLKKEIEDTINNIKRKYKNDSEFKASELEKENITIIEFKKRLNEDIKIKKLINRFVITNLKLPTEKEIKDVYDKAILNTVKSIDSLSGNEDDLIIFNVANTLKIVSGEHVELRQIFISCPKNATVAQIKSIQEKIVLVKEKLRKRSFADVAKQYSEDPNSKQKGGSIGIIAKGIFPENIDNIIFTMKVGDYNEKPIKTDFGYIFFRIDGKFASKDVTFEDAKNYIANVLYQSRLEKAYLKYIDDLKSKSDIRINKI